ncbi:Transposase family tnp2 [Rhizoctonia solani]|uniref:Transposase family tnp2 n=1 Tax=Rhizoctonia solani TaxID=456999 RepID=A0A8H7GYS6_9AGAM|nr:Transposase family tnp2 [Rhizoctonia solani]
MREEMKKWKRLLDQANAPPDLPESPRARGRRSRPCDSLPLTLRQRLRPPSPPDDSGDDGDGDGDGDGDVDMQLGPGLDTPGAGPSPSSRAQSPQCALMNGLTPEDYYTQNAIRKLVGDAFKLADYHKLTVEAFNYKVDTDISGRAYAKLPRAFPDRLPDLPTDPKLPKQINKILTYVPYTIDCCVNSCIAFTGRYKDLIGCPWCGQRQYKTDSRNTRLRRPRQQFQYLPIIPQFCNMYLSRRMAALLRYRSRLPLDLDRMTDVFHGLRYRLLLDELVSVCGTSLGHSFFSNNTNIALGLAMDGFCPFKKRNQQCWPLTLVNYNLPPSIQNRLENMLCLGVIPGPHGPKEINTFLEPFIKELEALATGVPAFDNLTRKPFRLYAYLLNAFGDMPAVAKLMCMKGHNGKLPCRACNIRGVPGTLSNTLYVPLARPFASDTHGPQRYDPLQLPLRTHPEYIRQALHVKDSKNPAQAACRSRHAGINGVSGLARIPGFVFPGSFPHDFMHLMFENVIPTLLDIWTQTGKYKKFGRGDKAYCLWAWSDISRHCPKTCNTLPSAFGRRVPNQLKNRRECTSESTFVFTTSLAPGLLRGRFQQGRYYDHFIRLVHLVNRCIDFQITAKDLNYICTGFAKWVKDYERFYYMEQPERIRACTLPLHALLHVADNIEAMGPVWTCWAFPMERFCGALGRASKSRRYPYSSLNRRVLQVTQLSQIKWIYGLTKELDLDDRRENIRQGKAYKEYEDLIFVKPVRHQTVPESLQGKLAAHISREVGVEEHTIKTLLRDREFKTFGKMQQLVFSSSGEVVGGDLVRSAMLTSSDGSTSRDASHVKFISRFSHWRWDTTRAILLPNTNTNPSFGRAEMFIVIGPLFFKRLAVEIGEAGRPRCHRIIVAIVLPFAKLWYHEDAKLVEYHNPSNNYRPQEVVDVTEIESLVGRVITDRKASYVIERTSVVGHVDMNDNIADLS